MPCLQYSDQPLGRRRSQGLNVKTPNLPEIPNTRRMGPNGMRGAGFPDRRGVKGAAFCVWFAKIAPFAVLSESD